MAAPVRARAIGRFVAAGWIVHLRSGTAPLKSQAAIAAIALASACAAISTRHPDRDQKEPERR
jgi:hypothetical protein